MTGMAHMADQKGTEVYDEAEEYDRKHGRTTCDDTEKPSGLTEAGNKGSATERESFRITRTS